VLLLAPLALRADDPPLPDEDAERWRRLATETAARLDRLGRLPQGAKEGQAGRDPKLPASAVPTITKELKARLVDFWKGAPPADQVTTRFLFELYLIAGPKGVHYLHDKGLLSKEHARKLKDARDALNERILRDLAEKHGKIAVNNFSASDTCRSDHDQTLFTEGERTPAEVIADYNRRFHEILKAEVGRERAQLFDPSLIELSNFDGTDTFPDWRLARCQVLFDIELKRQQERISANAEAYALIGAFREIVDQGSYASRKKTVRVYAKDPVTGVVTFTDEAAEDYVYRGVRPDRRRSHGAGAAIANWHFYNHHGGGRDPVEQAKYLLRCVGFGGFLVTSSDVEVRDPTYRVQLFEAIAAAGAKSGLSPELIERAELEYVRKVFGRGDEAAVRERWLALSTAAKLRASKAVALDPDSEVLRPEMLERWAREIGDASVPPRDWRECVPEAEARYRKTAQSLMVEVLLKSFPALAEAQSWAGAPPGYPPARLTEKLKRVAREHGVPLAELAKHFNVPEFEARLAASQYRELRACFSLLDHEDPKLADRLIEACPEAQRPRLEAVRRSVALEKKLRAPEPGTRAGWFAERRAEMDALRSQLMGDALLVKWKLEAAIESPLLAGKAIATRFFADMARDVGHRFGRKAKSDWEHFVDSDAGGQGPAKVSVKALLENNMNLANGLTAVHGVKAYIDAEREKPGSGASAMGACVVLEVAAQLPYIGELFDIKDAVWDGRVGGILMNLGARAFPHLAKRLLAITFVCDLVKTSAEWTGWVIFEPLAQDTLDKLYLGVLPAKEAGILIPGNPRAAETVLPSILSVVEVTPADLALCLVDEDERERLDEDLARRVKKGEVAAGMLDLERKRRLLWVWVKAQAERALEGHGVTPASYQDGKRDFFYGRDRAIALEAFMDGKSLELAGSSRVVAHEAPFFTTIVRRFARGELTKDDTDKEVLATLKGAAAGLEEGELISRAFQERLAARLASDYESGLKAHRDLVERRAAREQKEIQEHAAAAMRTVYGLEDTLEAGAAEARAASASLVAGECWEETGLEPMQPSMAVSAYRVEEEDGSLSQVTRLTLYGNVEEQPQPWRIDLALADPTGAQVTVAPPPVRAEAVTDAEGLTRTSYRAEGDATRLQRGGPAGAYEAVATARDATGAVLATASFSVRTPVSGVAVKAERGRDPRDSDSDVVLLTAPGLADEKDAGRGPPLASFYRARSADGPWFTIGASGSFWKAGERPIADPTPLDTPGRSTWYYACTVRRWSEAGVSVSEIGPATALEVDVPLAPPERITVSFERDQDDQRREVVRLTMPAPVERARLPRKYYEARIFRTVRGSGEPLVEIERETLSREKAEIRSLDRQVEPGVAYEYRVALAARAWTPRTALSEAVTAEVPAAIVDRGEGVRSLGMLRGETVALTPTGTARAWGQEVRRDGAVVFEPQAHGPAGMPRERVEALRAALGDDAKRLDAWLAALEKPDLPPGAALGLFTADRDPKTRLAVFAAPEPTSFTAPEAGRLGAWANLSTKPSGEWGVWLAFAARFRADAPVESLAGLLGPPPVTLEAVPPSVNRLAWKPAPDRARPPLESAPKKGLAVSLRYARAPEGPFEQEALDIELAAGERLLARARVAQLVDRRWIPRLSEATVLATPALSSVTLAERPEAGGGPSLFGVPSGPRPTEVTVPVRRGRTYTIAAAGRWSIFDVDGLECGPGGLSPEVAFARGISGTALEEPGRPPAALLARFSMRDGKALEAAVVGERLEVVAPEDGWLTLFANRLSYGGRIAGPARTSPSGPGLQVTVGSRD